jgi:hypothetical protein
LNKENRENKDFINDLNNIDIKSGINHLIKSIPSIPGSFTPEGNIFEKNHQHHYHKNLNHSH